MPNETILVVTQRDSTTTLAPLPSGPSLELKVLGGFPGPRGLQGEKGEPGTDGAASIPEVMDGGNF